MSVCRDASTNFLQRWQISQSGQQCWTCFSFFNLELLAPGADCAHPFRYPYAQTLSQACAVGRALVAHFSYSKQEDAMVENTDLLARYRSLSVSLTGF